MKLRESYRLTRLLARIAQAGADSSPCSDVQEEQELISEQGVRYDLYRPARHTRGALLALHGVTARGKREPRLVAFARALARSEVACVLPELPGLRDGRWQLRDLDLLEDVIGAAQCFLGRALALLGFSYGGSYCLLVATRPSVSTSLPFVISFGAYYELDALARHYLQLSSQGPQNDIEWEELIYISCIMAAEQPELLEHPADDLPVIKSLLARYCEEGLSSEKRRLFQQRLRSRRVIERYRWNPDSAVREALSPRGKLDAIRCPVGVVHDRNDVIVPMNEARRIVAELKGAGVEHELLMTSMLSHVSFANVLKVGELRALWRVMAPLAGGW